MVSIIMEMIFSYLVLTTRNPSSKDKAPENTNAVYSPKLNPANPELNMIMNLTKF